MKSVTLAAGFALLVLSLSVSAQTRPSKPWTLSKTPWGDPDIRAGAAKTYTKPWTVGFPITAERGYTNFEYARHEGNYAMFDSLSGARAIEKAAAEKAARKE
jgi:hypothetical protein